MCVENDTSQDSIVREKPLPSLRGSIDLLRYNFPLLSSQLFRPSFFSSSFLPLPPSLSLSSIHRHGRGRSAVDAALPAARWPPVQNVGNENRPIGLRAARPYRLPPVLRRQQWHLEISKLSLEWKVSGQPRLLTLHPPRKRNVRDLLRALLTRLVQNRPFQDAIGELHRPELERVCRRPESYNESHHEE